MACRYTTRIVRSGYSGSIELQRPKNTSALGWLAAYRSACFHAVVSGAVIGAGDKGAWVGTITIGRPAVPQADNANKVKSPAATRTIVDTRNPDRVVFSWEYRILGVNTFSWLYILYSIQLLRYIMFIPFCF